MPNEALETLHTAMLDTREGYEVAERDAETPDMKALFGRMIALRTHDHEQIHRALESKGVAPDDSGSFQATVHKVVTGARAAITGLDRDALSPFISGEEKILQTYDAAIDEAGDDSSVREMLASQRSALSAAIGEMKSLKAAADERP